MSITSRTEELGAHKHPAAPHTATARAPAALGHRLASHELPISKSEPSSRLKFAEITPLRAFVKQILRRARNVIDFQHPDKSCHYPCFWDFRAGPWKTSTCPSRSYCKPLQERRLQRKAPNPSLMVRAAVTKHASVSVGPSRRVLHLLGQSD